ncbi:MAG: Fic family protein [Syntrophomonas sp.]|nr:Fic family protein [Syntrophomonas sp.]
MANLEKYSNEEIDGIDPSIKLAVIHYQFESIHPDTLAGYGRCEFLEMAGQDVAFFD